MPIFQNIDNNIDDFEIWNHWLKKRHHNLFVKFINYIALFNIKKRLKGQSVIYVEPIHVHAHTVYIVFVFADASSLVQIFCKFQKANRNNP